MDKLGRILVNLIEEHPNYTVALITVIIGLVSLYALHEICCIRPIAYALQKLKLVEIEEVDEEFIEK